MAESNPEPGRPPVARRLFLPDNPTLAVPELHLSPLRDISLSPVRRVEHPEITSFRTTDYGPVQQSLEMLISQVYGTVPALTPSIERLAGYKRMFISDIDHLIQQGEILRFEFSTLLLPFAGPPGTRNRVLLFTGRNDKYYTIAQYDPVHNRMMLPE